MMRRFIQRYSSGLRTGVAGVLLCLTLTPALAQDYPARTITIIVPFTAGGTTDLIGRLIAPVLAKELGQSVVIENRAGAGGLIGANTVAKSSPDGYTLLLTNISYPLATLSAERTKRALFDANTDLTAVSVIANVPMIITAPPSVPAENLREFATLLQSGKVSDYAYGSTGVGSFMNVMGELFQKNAEVSMIHVPYKGTAPMKLELLADRVQMGGDQLSSSLNDVRAGTLRALAVTASKRTPSLPDVPTVKELGFPELESEGWNGILAPANTPAEILLKIQQAIAVAVRNPDVQSRFDDLGAEGSGSTREEHEQVLQQQITQFEPVISTMAFE